MKITSLLVPLAAALLIAPLPAQNLKEFEKNVTEFTLANGLHFIVLERHAAPVVSFHTYVNAGSVDDPKGRTGVAHMFEHMAFKGTAEIGSTNAAAEQVALAAVERAYDNLQAEKDKGEHADEAKLKQLTEALDAAIEKADTYVVPNLYPRIIEENGGVGMNASTSEDSTNYFYNFPANRMELWFYLESARFLRPVFRQFYKERSVVREERRMRTESDPQGKLFEQMLGTAISAHSYRVPGVGWGSDVENLRVEDAKEFYEKYYIPANITISVVGDVTAARVKQLAEMYFGRLAKKPLPRRIVTVEPDQPGPRRVAVESPAQPILLIAYHRPDQHDKDDAVFDVIDGVLSGGRTSILYKTMVRDKQIALAAGAEADLPGGKYPGLFMFYLVPAQGHSSTENEKEFDVILDQFKNEKIDAATLARVKTRTRAGLIRQLDNNSGLAQLLAAYHVNYGDWRKLFTSIEDIDKVTADDVQRVAKQYFTPQNRTVAATVAPAEVDGGAK
ncbi:MAG TPA: pitrilysin family protein [Bryobacteraceae bacterium]|nr:pitrilysin family protein [Bryobacteraceae bacterium]